MNRKKCNNLKVIINLYYAYVISYLTENTVSLQYKEQSMDAVMEITAPPPGRIYEANKYIIWEKFRVINVKVVVKDNKLCLTVQVHNPYGTEHPLANFQ